jgi:hypothetical protein
MSQLTVATLKDFCQNSRLPVEGKKADLLARVEEYFETK